MKNHRIGNDINVKWSIFSEGAPYNLEGLQVTLYLKDSLGKRAVTGFSLQENNVLWRFAGKDQSHTGRYSLELVVNEGKTSMITTDICNFVNLVQHSCMIGGSDAGNIETDSISLTSDLGSVPVIIDESLSEVSENAIANKTVTKELKKKVNKTDLATINGQSITEGGNIVIQGSGSNPDLSEYAKKTEVATSLTKKVDKVPGMGLSSNDFTDADKDKLSDIEEGAQKNVVASFLNGASLQGLPFGYVGGTYQSHQFNGEVNDEIDLGVIKETYYGNIAFSYEDKLYEFKIADLKSEGATLGTILVRVTDDNHLIVKPFAPRVALLGWRTYGDKTKMPSTWVEGGGSGGGSYDDTGIKKDISDLKENDALQDAELAKLSAEIGNKQDTITDLATIRSGAAKGATALQSVPETYATKTYVDNKIAEEIDNALTEEY